MKNTIPTERPTTIKFTHTGARSLHAEERKNGRVTLVVVDMQPPFLACCKDSNLVPAVVSQVKLAMALGWYIVLVEVKPRTYGPTVRPILGLLEGKYDRYTRVTKEGDDGSPLVLEACQPPLNYPSEVFRVTGLLINACMSSTAWGLVARHKTCLVRVIKEACGTNREKNAAWAAFKQGPRLVVSTHKIDNPIKCHCINRPNQADCDHACPGLFETVAAYWQRLWSLIARYFGLK